MTETMTILVHALIISQIDTAMMYWMWLTTFICVSFKQSSTLQQDWLPVNRNMTAYRLQSGTSCIGYRSVNGSSSSCVFSCTTAWAIYHPAICPACVSRSLSTPAADAYDTLHVETSLSHAPTKAVCYGPRSFIAGQAMWNSLPASLHDYYYYRVLRAICCQPVDGSLICFM